MGGIFNNFRRDKLVSGEGRKQRSKHLSIFVLLPARISSYILFHLVSSAYLLLSSGSMIFSFFFFHFFSIFLFFVARILETRFDIDKIARGDRFVTFFCLCSFFCA